LRAIDIWIGEAADLGRGYGTRMMRHALERCFADPAVKAVLIDPLASNTRARRFYERLGFRCIEPMRPSVRMDQARAGANVSMRSPQRSAGRAAIAVDRPSATRADGAATVTEAWCVALLPVAGSKM
jgi:ribosomal protein S18 acetylase RimI-like enzyme